MASKSRLTAYSDLDARNDSPPQSITVLLATFAGLGLPRTLSLPVHKSTSVHDVLQAIHSRLPGETATGRLIVTTTSNKQLTNSNHAPVASLLSGPFDTFLPLRLSAPLCGGKGGFGSQLRAAGGRMSSRKKRDQNQNANGSNRNLDGRRLRVLEQVRREADKLANQQGRLEKAEAEKKKGREDYLHNTTARIDAIESGKLGGDKGRLDAEYVESKEQAEQKTREDVLRNLKGMVREERLSDGSTEEDVTDTEMIASGPSKSAAVEERKAHAYFGFDEDEDSEDDEDEDEDEMDEDPDTTPEAEDAYQGKGKDKVA